MFHSNRTTRTMRARAATVLCAALLATGATAASPKLQTIDVTPASKTISVGQQQSFTATGTFSNRSKRVLGPAISNIAPGGRDTCAVLSSGGVECWGSNDYGQLGDGDETDSLVPRPVKGIHTATSAAAGNAHTCALLASGAVKCWGDNNYGELGDGNFGGIATTPVGVVGISTATALAVGAASSCALLVSGAVQCWGSNGDGELGNGSEDTLSDIPVEVTEISTATALASEEGHSCALLASGSVQCWGSNANGELGNGTISDKSNTPVRVVGISTATAVAAGLRSSCALLASGVVKCWGQNASGQLGNGTNVASTTPVSVTGIRTAVAIAAGGYHYCAVLRSGSAKCWGGNGLGELGDGTTTDSNIPVRVQAINSPTRLAGGYQHTCALFSGGMMRCWGWDFFGQLGNRKTPQFEPLPVTVFGTPGVVWTSSDSSKATITDRGVATGLAVGNTTITATTAGFINDNAVLTVK